MWVTLKDVVNKLQEKQLLYDRGQSLSQKIQDQYHIN